MHLRLNINYRWSLEKDKDLRSSYYLLAPFVLDITLLGVIYSRELTGQDVVEV